MLTATLNAPPEKCPTLDPSTVAGGRSPSPPNRVRWLTTVHQISTSSPSQSFTRSKALPGTRFHQVRKHSQTVSDFIRVLNSTSSPNPPALFFRLKPSSSCSSHDLPSDLHGARTLITTYFLMLLESICLGSPCQSKAPNMSCHRSPDLPPQFVSWTRRQSKRFQRHAQARAILTMAINPDYERCRYSIKLGTRGTTQFCERTIGLELFST